MQRVIMLVDCQSFYASVEKAARPWLEGKPVVVAGDPERRSGIILAACPIAKSYGITTAEKLGEAQAKCPGVVVIRPRMQTYIQVSLLISQVFGQFTDLVEPFSIDEQFLDVTRSQLLFGSPWAIATQIQARVLAQTGVRVRVGIGANKILAKMACDIFAKKNESGVFELRQERLAADLWPLPIGKMFGVGRRMTAHFMRMGMPRIGDVACTPLPELAHKMRARFGRKSDISAQVYWNTANGIDPSPVTPHTHDGQQSIGHAMTLPRDYSEPREIETVLLELSDEVCRRARAKHYMGSVVSAGVRGANMERPHGFSRQQKLPDETNLARDVFAAAREIFYTHWDEQPVRQVSVTLGGLSDDRVCQLRLDSDLRARELAYTIDRLQERFGRSAVMRAASLTPSGQALDRAQKIGGHYR